MKILQKTRGRLARLLERIVSSFCWHKWVTNLIICENPNTHRDTKNCIKCGKEIITFSGTRKQWKAKHGFDY